MISLPAEYRIRLGRPVPALEKWLRVLEAEPYNRSAKTLDNELVCAQHEAVHRLNLFLWKQQTPGETVQGKDGEFGFVPGGVVVERTPIEHLVSVRWRKRQQAQWDEADRLRRMAEDAGYVLGDSPEGTDWIWIDQLTEDPGWKGEPRWIHEAEIGE